MTSIGLSFQEREDAGEPVFSAADVGNTGALFVSERGPVGVPLKVSSEFSATERFGEPNRTFPASFCLRGLFKNATPYATNVYGVRVTPIGASAPKVAVFENTVPSAPPRILTPVSSEITIGGSGSSYTGAITPGSPFSITFKAVDEDSFDVLTFSVSAVGGTLTALDAGFDQSFPVEDSSPSQPMHTLTLTGTTGLSGDILIQVEVSDGRGGTATITVLLTVSTPYLLDDYATTFVAYSFRRLSTAYTGPVVRVALENPSFFVDMYPDSDGFINTDDALVLVPIAIAHGLSTTIYLRIFYDQSGNGFDAVFIDKAEGNNDPPIFAVGGVPYLMSGGRPTVVSALNGLSGTAGLIGGGNHQLIPPGRRMMMHAVISRDTADTDSGGSQRVASAAVLFGNNWAGSPGGQDTALGYAGNFGAAYANNSIESDRANGTFTTRSRASGGDWLRDQIHIVNTRRYSDADIDCYRNNNFEGTTLVDGLGVSTNSPSGIFNFTGIKAGDLDPFRCSELILWHVDPGAIQAGLYTKTVGAFTV